MEPVEQNPQLLFLGKKDATRLLEVYVKRSLSLNDGPSSAHKHAGKWVTRAERLRRHSSDSSVHLGPGEDAGDIVVLQTSISPESPTCESSSQPGKMKKNAKKAKKSGLLKSFLSLFSRKETAEKEETDTHLQKARISTPPDTPSPSISCLPATFNTGGDHQNKSVRKKHSFKRFSFRISSSDEARKPEKPSSLMLASTVHVTDAVPVESTRIYYEKVSEELERIVKEVKDSPTDVSRGAFPVNVEADSVVAENDGETIEKIIRLLIQQGDGIEEKLQETGGVGSLFGNLSYTSFQQLADRYVKEEIPSLLHVDKAAPELVRFAFTLDFTAKVAGLSNQAVSRIMGFGNRYLQDRFTQMSKSTTVEFHAKATHSFSGID